MAEVTFEVRRACLTEGHSGPRNPSNFRKAGSRNSPATTNALTGFPGRPTTGTWLHTARIVGLPGRIETPWTRIPGGPKVRMTPAVRSRTLTEDPAAIA